MQIDHVTVDSLGSSKHELSRTDQILSHLTSTPCLRGLGPTLTGLKHPLLSPQPQQAARFDLAVISCLSRKELTQKQHLGYPTLSSYFASVKIIPTFTFDTVTSPQFGDLRTIFSFLEKPGFKPYSRSKRPLTGTQ